MYNCSICCILTLDQTTNLLDLFVLKAFEDDRIVTKNRNITCGKVKDIVGTGENADYLCFPLFPQCFLKTFSSGPEYLLRC